jgi:ATP-dependent DNA ligase
MKVKVRHEGVFVVGGIRDVNAFDGVLVGKRVGDALHYRGVVEWGFKAADVLALLEHARRWNRPDSSFVGAPRGMRSVTWVEPRLEAEVSYAEIVEGRVRAPRASPRQAGDDDVAARETNAARIRKAVTGAHARVQRPARASG